MPVAWQEEFAQYRFFYAPAYRETAMRALGDLSINRFAKESEKFREELAELVPTELKAEVPQVQSGDWTKIGADQLKSAMKETNLVFSKLVLALALLQKMANAKKQKQADDRNSFNVYDAVKLHPALFVIENLDTDKFEENVIDDPTTFRALQQATQQRAAFYHDILKGRPATYRTLHAVKIWMKENHPDIKMGDIVAISERRQLKPARKEIVKP